MAATWDITIQVTALASREIRVTATRTDGDDVRTYSAEGTYDTVNNTPQELLAAYTDLFWNLYQAEIAKETQVAALIGQAEQALATALVAKETE